MFTWVINGDPGNLCDNDGCHSYRTQDVLGGVGQDHLALALGWTVKRSHSRHWETLKSDNDLVLSGSWTLAP